MWHWLMTPLSGATDHLIEPWAFWHARCMVLAWGILLPLGSFVARFYKVTPKQDWPRALDNKLWWHGHRFLQWSGVVVMSVGLVLVLLRNAPGQSSSTFNAQLHALAGWSVMAFGWLQVLAATLRGSSGGPAAAQLRGDHYDMTLRRRWFEGVHKKLGWVTLMAAAGVIASGLYMVDAPRWMPLLLSAWYLLLAQQFWRLQKAGRCVDTYQAIWGPDTIHPGNRNKATL